MTFLLRLFAGIPLGFLLQSLLAIILQSFLGWSYPFILLVLFITLLASFLLHILSIPHSPRIQIKIRIIDCFILIIFSLFSIWRMSRYYFLDNGKTVGDGHSDYNYHLMLVNSLSTGCNKKRKHIFSLASPLVFNKTLVYPILPEFYSAFLLNCGAPITSALGIPCLFCIVSTLFLVYSFTLSFTNSHLAANLALPLWVFSGGIGFTMLFQKGYTMDINLRTLISKFTPRLKAFWFQTIVNFIHPQRCSTFAIPITFTFFILFLKAAQMDAPEFIYLASIYVGISPQAHIYSYVSIGLYCVGFLVLHLRLFKPLIIFAFTANLVAIPLCLPFFEKAIDSNFIRYSPIWFDPEYSSSHSFFEVIWRALGVVGAIAFFNGFVTANSAQIKFYLPTLPIVYIALTFMFQPWAPDNIKLLHYGFFLPAIGMVSQYFSTLFQRRRLLLILGILFVSSILSGLIHSFYLERHTQDVVTKRIKKVGHWIAENTPPFAVFFCQSADNPGMTIAGRQQLIENSIHLISHGINNETIKGISKRLNYATKPELFKELGVDYLVVTEIYKRVEHYLNMSFMENVFMNQEGAVFKVLEEIERG